MVKFGVWVVDLMLQYAVGILNAAGHDRGGVVWLELTLELSLVGLVWPFCGALCRVFLASTGLLEGVLVAKGASEEMPAAVGGAARQPHGLPPPQNARLMRGSEPLPSTHCGNKGRHSLWTPSGLIHPTRFPNQHVAVWVPSHTGAKRLKVKN